MNSDAEAMAEQVGCMMAGLSMMREAGAQAVGVLESLYADREIPDAIRPVVRDILAKWRAGQSLMGAA